ncbi:MAG: hypothetical protein L0H64_03365 [Pseudonocardia sp.]|nr:hypothetical protein [Pseudonocardia sp.]
MLVSSHLIHELQSIADRIVVLDRRRVLADADTATLCGAGAGAVDTVRVRVQPDQLEELGTVLRRAGGSVVPQSGSAVAVTGLAATAVGELVAAHALTVYELTPLAPTLEDAYLRLVADDLPGATCTA